jgi:glutamyl-tRNA reductase
VNLLVVGCSFRDTPLDFRERLAFAETDLPRALHELATGFAAEAAILSTCNRVEVFLAAGSQDAIAVESVSDFVAGFHSVPPEHLRRAVYSFRHNQAIRHLFRVSAGLDSLIVGESQIAAQVKLAYETARCCQTAGMVLHTIFQQASRVAARVRRETGIGRGGVSVSSAAVEYVRQVFDHFADKTILVIGAGKMGELALKHLSQLQPSRILVTNRSPEKGRSLAEACQGTAMPWENLEAALSQADIVLSSTGSTEPIMTRERYLAIRERRQGGPMVIFDMAVPRDFDPAIHDGDQTCLFNIDDLKRIQQRTLDARRRHLPAAESIVEEEVQRFVVDWSRREHAPLIARLSGDLEAKRRAIVEQLLKRLNGRLTDDDRAYIEGAFRLLQNQFLHGPISALTEEAAQGTGQGLREALRKLFRLHD